MSVLCEYAIAAYFRILPHILAECAYHIFYHKFMFLIAILICSVFLWSVTDRHPLAQTSAANSNRGWANCVNTARP